jgi:hypothetical protein
MLNLRCRFLFYSFLNFGSLGILSNHLDFSKPTFATKILNSEFLKGPIKSISP